MSKLSVPVQTLSLDGGGGNNTFTLINAPKDKVDLNKQISDGRREITKHIKRTTDDNELATIANPSISGVDRVLAYAAKSLNALTEVSSCWGIRIVETLVRVAQNARSTRNIGGLAA